MRYENLLVIIPARKNSQRLPDKCLLDIGGQPMFGRVANAALQSDVGPVVIATDDPEIFRMVHSSPDWVERGINPIMTGEAASGSDRCAMVIAAAEEGSGKKFDYIMNLQCDIPFVPVELIRAVADYRMTSKCNVVTAACSKSIVNIELWSAELIQFNRRKLREHIGIYAFTKQALLEFHQTPQTALELNSKLELNRRGLDVECIFWPYAPLEVNTQEDVDLIRSMLQ